MHVGNCVVCRLNKTVLGVDDCKCKRLLDRIENYLMEICHDRGRILGICRNRRNK